jgi:ATP-dependent DNA helicase RecG
MLDLKTPLADIQLVGPRFSQNFARLGIRTVQDLLYHFPSRYEDFSQIYPINDLEPGQQATIQGIIEDVRVRHTWKKHLTIIEAFITDDTGRIRAVWFNQPYLKNVLRPGRLANFSGKVSISDEDIYLSHPTHELVGESETKHTARLVPVYPETRGLTSKGIRFILKPILDRLPRVDEWLPIEVRKLHDLPELNAALHSVHFPERIEDANQAKKRFAFEDLFLLQALPPAGNEPHSKDEARQRKGSFHSFGR